MWCLPLISLPYPTLSYIEASTHPYRDVSYLFLLQYSTIYYPAIYIIGLLYTNTVLNHSLMCPIQIWPNLFRAKTTQGLNNSSLRLNRPTPIIMLKRPCLTNTGPKRPIFSELVASFLSLYLMLLRLHKQRLPPSNSICNDQALKGVSRLQWILQSITGEPKIETIPAPFPLPCASKVKKISNYQELIQSDPTSCPKNQKGNN